MQTTATPKRLRSHLIDNSAHVANGEETVRTWEASVKEVACKQQRAQNDSPSHLAVNAGHVASSKEIVRTWDASGKGMVCKQQQPQNGSPRSLLSILGM